MYLQAQNIIINCNLSAAQRRITSHLPGFAEAMASQDHVEGVLARHGHAQVEVAVCRLFQQQRATQVRVLNTI